MRKETKGSRLNKTILILLLAVAVFQGCAHSERSYKPTFTLREFYNMPIEDKVIEYIRFIQQEGSHNPERILMEDMIILHGKEAVPIAVGIIAADMDSFFAERFIFILGRVHVCCYDLSRDMRYVNFLEYVMESSKDKFNRSKAEGVLETIRTKRGGRGDINRRRSMIEEALEDYEKNLNPIYKNLKPEEGS